MYSSPSRCSARARLVLRPIGSPLSRPRKPSDSPGDSGNPRWYASPRPAIPYSGNQALFEMDRLTITVFRELYFLHSQHIPAPPPLQPLPPCEKQAMATQAQHRFAPSGFSAIRAETSDEVATLRADLSPSISPSTPRSSTPSSVSPSPSIPSTAAIDGSRPRHLRPRGSSR